MPMSSRNDTAIWSGLFTISAESGQTLQAQIRQAIVAAILDRQIAASMPLPSCRVLAEKLGVARGTVVLAFQQLVDQPLHLGDVVFCDPRDLYLHRAGQVGADDEELILNLAERLIQLLVGQAGSRDSQQRIQFIDVAVSDNARICLADAASVNQRGLARVAALCINTTDSHLAPSENSG